MGENDTQSSDTLVRCMVHSNKTDVSTVSKGLQKLFKD